MKDSSVPISSSATPASVRSVTKSQEQPASVSPPAPVVEKQVASITAVENGTNQEGGSVYSFIFCLN